VVMQVEMVINLDGDERRKFRMGGVKPGPSTVAGLKWLARVGPAPLGAWGIAMGWGQAAVYSHARRLRVQGWLERCSRTRGEGSLIYASRIGVRCAGVAAAAVEKRPAPVTWPHCEACAWTAAWLTARGRGMVGPREMLVRLDWRGELRWHERGELRRRGHRPDLGGRLPDGQLLPIEVELTAKSSARLKAVLALHAEWIAAGKSAAVIYVCGDDEIAERVLADGAQAGLSVDRGTIRIELVATIQREAVEACSTLASTEWHLARSGAA
jgi:hypothetical protein